MKFDASNATCSVFTYKEGLLSAVGHDVKLAVTEFEIVIESGHVRATFRADSLVVDCAMRDGREDRAVLSAADKKTIEGYVQNDILSTRRYPTVTFSSTNLEADDDDGWLVEGDLTLHGRTRSLSAHVSPDGEHLRTRITLRQPDFGITPFKALLGALRIQPQVDVELRVPLGAAERMR